MGARGWVAGSELKEQLASAGDVDEGTADSPDGERERTGTVEVPLIFHGAGVELQQQPQQHAQGKDWTAPCPTP